MKVCVITGKETLNKTKNIPVHKDGRAILDQTHVEFNKRVLDGFIKEQQETQGEKAMSEELLRKIAPQYNKSQVLRMIQREGVEGIFQALDRASEKSLVTKEEESTVPQKIYNTEGIEEDVE